MKGEIDTVYSRKNIRAYQPMTRYLPAGSDEGESAVTPPPDYTGMAFYERKDTADYPETVIPQAETVQVPANELPLQEELAPPAVEEDYVPAFSEEELPSLDAEQSPEKAEEAPRSSPDPIEGATGESLPLVTPAWLRSLTLEDLLLFWLILLLLSGEPEDQIYVLLGLLLFTGR